MKLIPFLSLLLGFNLMIGQTNYLVENFDYPVGEELTNHGWFAHSAAATNPIVVSSSGLNWVMSSYIGSDVGNAVLVNNTGQDINKPFDEYISTGDVYASFLFKANSPVQSAGEGFFFHFGIYNNVENPDFTNLSTAFRARTHVLQGTDPDTQFKLGLSFNTASYSEATGDLDLSKTYLVVVKYSFVDGEDNDNVSLYVFADGDDITSEPATPDIGPLTGSASDIGTLQAVALRQYNAAQDVTVDGIYVRTVWNMTDPGGTSNINSSDNDFSAFDIYPNPSNNGLINIKSDIAGDKTIEIYNINGHRVYKNSNFGNSVDVQSLQKGIYFIKIDTENHRTIQKLILN